MGKHRWHVERLAQWWSQASEESRFLLMRKAIDGPPSKEVPSLETVRLAAYLAESERAEIEVR